MMSRSAAKADSLAITFTERAADGSDALKECAMAEDDISVNGVPELPGGKQWYVLKVQSNRERTIRESLQRRIRQEGLEEFFGEIFIPTEKVAETKGGKKRVTEQKLYPGYIMIQMELNEETWYLVRTTSGVGDFTGAAGKPIPMETHEIERMLGLAQKAQDPQEAPKPKIPFEIGHAVKIKEGAFESFEGTVESIDEQSGKITVLIQIFGRPTPVDLEHWQAERV